jgi:nicotinamidase-related amidase
MEPAMKQLAGLLKRARAAKTPIIHIAQTGDPGDIFDRQSEGGRFLPEVTPAEGETVIEKPLPNSFARTGLQDRLTAIGRKELIVAGFMTHMCVSSTVRAAFDLDYHVTLAADATATRSLPAMGSGAPIKAAQIQAAALAALGDYFATIVPSAAIPA